MKKILALILAACLLCTALAGCSGSSDDKTAVKEEKKGAIIQTYLSNPPVSIDPSAFYSSSDAIKIMGLIYEGLTTVDENGKVKKALAKSWEDEVDERDGYLKLTITLRNSRWSDGIVVDADDFIYAWTRILLPESNNENAAMLYPILNAKKVKEGLVSVNDLGISAIKDNILEITFEKDFTDIDYFLKQLASPALVPLREEVVTDDSSWAVSGGTSYVTNGPFKIKTWNSSELTLERSVYYRGVSDSSSNKDNKIVKPYRIVNLYSEGRKPDAQAERYANTELFYLSLNGASKDLLASYGKKAKTEEMLSTYCIFFNLNDPLFEDVRVRQALSLAIDRSKITNIPGTGVEPATGLVPYGIEDTSRSKDFRKQGGNLISTTQDLEKTKQLLSDTGVSGGKIVVECSNGRDFEKTMMNYIALSWVDLGFDVTINTPNQNYLYNKANGVYPFNQNDANIIVMDIQSMTTDAYSMLTAFSGEYGGHFIDVTTGPDEEDVVYGSHLTGFNDPAYDEICAKIVNAANTKDRTAAMHEAEQYLMEQLPVAPLFFNCDKYVSQKLSGIKYDKYGRMNLTKLKQSNYKKYLPTDETN